MRRRPRWSAGADTRLPLRVASPAAIFMTWAMMASRAFAASDLRSLRAAATARVVLAATSERQTAAVVRQPLRAARGANVAALVISGAEVFCHACFDLWRRGLCARGDQYRIAMIECSRSRLRARSRGRALAPTLAVEIEPLLELPRSRFRAFAPAL
jgi:hypothetical protein